ncbi:MAG: mechanosensitive ion channel [Bacteroidia bacterium]|nr:mechanosensitive ion channel [Bacteroidia bacterium]
MILQSLSFLINQASPVVKEVKQNLSQQEEKLNAYFDRLLQQAGDFAPNLVSALLVLLVGMWLIKRISTLATKAMQKRDLDISLRTFLRSLISIGLKIVLIVTVAGMIGIGTTSFVTILGAAGLAVGLALQGSLSNFAGGVLILIFKPFKVGDTIEAGGQTGEVKEIQIFNTILVTADHKTVILPNGPLSNGTIVNNTRQGDLRIDVVMNLDANSNTLEIKNAVWEVLHNNPMVLKEPEPLIIISIAEAGAIKLNVKPYCKPEDTTLLSSNLYEELKTAFDKKQIKAAIQQQKIQNA